MIYFFVFFMLASLRLISELNFNRGIVFYWLSLIFLFAFSAFRFEVGCDWSGYLNQFLVYGQVPLSGIWEQREPLWVAIFSIQWWLGAPYPWINVFSSLVFFFGAHAFAKRQPDRVAFLVFLFPILILNMPMSAIRQGAAIGVLMFAFNAFIDKSLIRFVALTFVASILHQSALVFLLLSPLVGGNYSRKRLVLAVALALPGIAIMLSGSAAELAEQRYLNTDVEAAGAIFRVGLLLTTGLYFLAVLRHKWEAEFPQDFKLAMIGSLMMVFLIGALPLSTVIADRLGYYLIPVQAMILSRIGYLPWLTLKRAQILAPYLILGMTLAFWVSLSSHAQKCYEPYDTWLFDTAKVQQMPIW